MNTLNPTTTLSREFIINELSEYDEYNELDFNTINENDINIIFNTHCAIYSEEVKAIDIYEELNKSGFLMDSPDGYQAIGDLYKKTPRDIHTVKTSLSKIKVSCDHLLETSTGWKKSSNIKPNELVLSKNGLIEVLSNKITSHEEVYDWEVLHENHRYYCDGISSHNTGKTFIMLCAARNAQAMGYKLYWYDSENAVDKKLMESFGIDVSKVWYEPCNTVEGLRHSVTNLTNNLIEAKRGGYKIPKVMILLDSIGNLGTEKEVADAGSGSMKEDMTRAKRIKSLFRILITKMAEVKIPFLYSNHTYKTTDFYAAWKGSGGCLTPGHEVLIDKDLMLYSKIEDLKPDDNVETLFGKKSVTDTFEFDKQVIEVEFEDGSKLTCSEDHRFYLGGGINNDSNWIKAKDLVINTEILKLVIELKKLKVKSIKRLESTKVHDISVDEVQHYITKNGVINHNSGREYGASIILMLTKAKLKDKKKDNEQVGVIITAKPNKNRFAKPQVVKTHLDYKLGLNAYTGLQDYMEFGWEEHGVEKGEVLTAKQLKKKSAGPKGNAIEFKCEENLENGTESTMYFVPGKNSPTIAVKELGRHLTSKEFFSDIFFTTERLKAIDEYAKPFFNYAMDDNLPDDELFDMDETEEDI